MPVRQLLELVKQSSLYFWYIFYNALSDLGGLFVIVSQTGCSPTSAIASFSKQPSSLHRKEPFTDDDIITPHTPSPPNLPDSVSPLSYSPPLSPVDGDVLIPCEFCGVTLEENVVFHHQVFPQWA